MVAKTKRKRAGAGAGAGGRKQGRKTVKPIDDPKKRVVTFSKRHATLFRAAGHLSAICGAHVAVVAFSPSKRATPYAFGSPSVDTVLLRLRRRLHAQDQHGATGALEEEGAAAIPVIRRELDETKEGVKAETARKKAVDAAVKQGMAAAATTSWWKADANVIGADALPNFEAALHRLREDAIRRLDPLHAADHPIAGGLGAGGATHY